MPSLSIPQIVAIAMAALAILLVRKPGAARLPLGALAAACAAQAMAVSLRWDFGVGGAHPAQIAIAALIPGLAWAAFATLSGERGWRRWLHLSPVVPATLIFFASRWLLDPFFVTLYLGYGTALLWLWRKGPDALSEVTLAGSVPASRAVLIAGATLIASAVVDSLVALALAFGRGRSAETIIGLAQLGWILSAGLAAFIAGRAVPETEEGDADEPDADAANDPEIVAAVDRLLADEHLYREPNLTLIRVARKTGIPARRISAAINRHRGRNVSQHVNALRIAEACRLLGETDRPVTAVMFDSGFQTKSNFNKEFLRATGLSPSAWRAARRLTS